MRMAEQPKIERGHYVNSKEPQRLATVVDCNCPLHQVHNIAELERMLRRHIASTLGLPVECVTPSTRFVEDLGLNVLSALEIVLSLETLLEIQLPDAQAAQVNCVKDFLDGFSNTVFSFTER